MVAHNRITQYKTPPYIGEWQEFEPKWTEPNEDGSEIRVYTRYPLNTPDGSNCKVDSGYVGLFIGFILGVSVNLVFQALGRLF